METTTPLAIQKMPTQPTEAEAGLLSFLRRYFYLMLTVLLTFVVIAACLVYALFRTVHFR